MGMFEAMQKHSREVMLFAIPAAALVLILAVDILLTLVHTVQEWKGRLWRYFGAIAGVHVPDLVGVTLFIFALAALLWILSFAGIAGYLSLWPGWNDDGMGALGALIAGRLSDRFYSHVRLDRQGYRPNPGLPSTPYYLVEAVLLAVLFLRGLRSHWIAAAVGLTIGWLFFYSVLPGVRLFRAIPSLRREPRWKPGEEIPDWAR